MRSIKTAIKWILHLLPQKTVFFESAPDFSDNTRAVFDEMVRRGLHKKYVFIWLTSDKHRHRLPGDRSVHIRRSGWLARILLHTAKCVICCNRFTSSTNPRAVNIFLNHGSPIKSCKGYYEIPEDRFDYLIVTSETMKKIQVEDYGLKASKFVVLGFARNDALTAAQQDLSKYFGNRYKRIIVWYPTYRQTRHGRKTGCTQALPIIWDQEKAIEINECAKRNDVLIVIKPHFAQDVSLIKELHLSNVVFIDDRFFTTHQISSYQFLGSCDALLTDYSSVYYDYLLCNKPIGLIWEDYEEYDRNPGFAVDMDYMMKGGVKIYTVKDFKSFIEDVANGNDRLQAAREEIRDVANCSTDGRNAERVVDFVEEVLERRGNKLHG